MRVIQSSLWYGIAILLLSIVSCDRPECANENPVFTRFTPDAKEYKRELAKEMQRIGQERLGYWFDRYEWKETGEYIFVNAQGHGLCAMARIRVESWDNKIKGLRGRGGYRGAGLIGLRVDVVQLDSGQVELVYSGLDRISD